MATAIFQECALEQRCLARSLELRDVGMTDGHGAGAGHLPVTVEEGWAYGRGWIRHAAHS
jgi:hypothetical protein